MRRYPEIGSEGHDDIPYFDKSHRYWLCADESIASQCVDDHPGDTVMLFDRSEGEGKMCNIRVYWSSSMPDTNKLPSIKRGRLRF